MAREQIDVLLSYWATMRQERGPHEETWQDITDLFMPFRGDVTTITSPGNDRNATLFDTTGMVASDDFANFLKGSVIPSSVKWLRLGPAFEDRDSVQVRKVADITSDRISRAFAQSNFYQSGGTYLRDLSTLGNGILEMQQRPPILGKGRNTFGGFSFKPVFITDAWWIVGNHNEIEIFCREVRMPAIAAARFFKEDMGKDARDKMKQRAYTEECTYLHFVYQNQEGVPGGALNAPDKKPIVSHWVAMGDRGPEEIRVRGFDRSPYIISRWTVVRGETYGTGKGHIARPDAAGLNELGRQILIAAGRDLNKPMMIENESVVQLDTGPSGITVVKPFQKMAPTVIDHQSRYDVADLIRSRDRDQVNKAFMSELTQDPDSQTRSAEAEFSRRQRQIARLAAPADIITTEFLTPLVDSAMHMMLQSGALPEMQQLIDERGGELELELSFESEFFTAQKSAQQERVSALVDRKLLRQQQTGDPRWTIDLDVMGVSKFERRAFDVPAEIFANDDEISDRLKALQQQQQGDQQIKAAQVAGDLAEKTGTDLSEVAGQLAEAQ